MIGVRAGISALALALLPAHIAWAQQVAPCDWKSSVQNIAEPWFDNIRSFANGDVRVIVMDVAEPAAGALHLLILSPPRDDFGFMTCQMVSTTADVGFSTIDFSGLASTYDPAEGLILTIPVTAYTGQGAYGFSPLTLRVSINQATGTVRAVY